ncbi:MAG: stage II sporulation protein P [Oscillospiraceae bacterium]|nr:stage II sporulation protein P [Oscillospiraceae bacterium]
MGKGKQLALVGAAVLCAYLFCCAPEKAAEPMEKNEMRSVMRQNDSIAQSSTSAPIHAPASAAEEAESPRFAPSRAENAVAMTISATALIKNETGYQIDAAETVKGGTSLRLSSSGPQILIIHTHSSEAYTPAGLDRYEESDNARTEDAEYNIIRVGDELTRLFEQAGLRVIHDRGVYDYPSYTGSYSRSGAAVEQYLSEYPSLSVVLDVHRDALGADDVIYKTVAEEAGTCASQAMLLVGTDETGLEHPFWRSNLSLALYLQNALLEAHPTLMRPVAVVPQRYNQQLCPGMLILEVGSSGNTLQEALAAIRLFAGAAAPALLALVE